MYKPTLPAKSRTAICARLVEFERRKHPTMAYVITKTHVIKATCSGQCVATLAYTPAQEYIDRWIESYGDTSYMHVVSGLEAMKEI